MFLELINKKQYDLQARQLFLELNEDISKTHNSLTILEIKEVIKERDNMLVNYGLVELGIDVLGKLMKGFRGSSYIVQEDYMETLIEIQEIFYFVKRETDDTLSDDVLIELLIETFNNDCRGSLDLLWINMERYATKFRRENLE
ncbi:DUF6323 family protein [Wukongibacter baidiensis]|uniref:DUF6323 family protein n=1 Tax=Wukongibacter baidiensis TaxID=1723361 RepID=UPI003D7F1EBA